MDRETVVNICLVNLSIEPYPPRDGQAISTCIQQTARELRAWGHVVTIVSRLAPGTTGDRGQVAIAPQREARNRVVGQLRHLRSRFRGLDWPGQHEYLREVRRVAERFATAPDLFVVANDFHASAVLKDVHPDSRAILWLHNEQRTNHRRLRAAMRDVDRVVAVSGYVRDWALDNFPLTDDRVAVVHNGVNLSQFRPAKRFPRSDEPPRILFVGRIDEGKGPDILLTALTGLMREGMHASVTLAGGRQLFHGRQDHADEYFRKVITMLERLGGAFLGPVERDDLADIMRQHDIVCVPSRANEAFSLVALEAMASGCAVVASDRGGLPEACGGAALHVDPDDRSMVREALGSLLQDPDLLRSYKERGLRHARSKSWATTAGGMLEAAVVDG